MSKIVRVDKAMRDDGSSSEESSMGNSSDNEDSMSLSDTENSDDNISNIPNDLELVIDSSTESSDAEEEAATTSSSSNQLMVAEKSERTKFNEWMMQKQHDAIDHYTDLNTPHAFAGIINAHLLIREIDGVAMLHAHVSREHLLDILWFITEPKRMVSTGRKFNRVLKMIRATTHLQDKLVLCTGSRKAEKFWRAMIEEDDPVWEHLLGINSTQLANLPSSMHLCHLGEALYLRWILDGILPTSIWHIGLLMYTAERMEARAMFMELNELMYGDKTRSNARYLRIVGAGYWDDFKNKFMEIKQTLQEKYPTWRAEIGQQLERYATQATTAVKQAYGQTKVWASNLSARYQNEFKPWLKEQYEGKIKPGAQRAWESTREAARKLVEYASQARAYVSEHLSELVQRIRTDPRFAQLKQKLRALAEEARLSGARFWDYIKTQLEQGSKSAQELLAEVKNQIDKLNIKLSKPREAVKKIESAQPTSQSSAEQSTSRFSRDETNISQTPVTEEGELDLDFINNYRPMIQRLGQPKEPNPVYVDSKTGKKIITVNDNTVSEPTIPEYYRPMLAEDRAKLFVDLPQEMMSVEALEQPPPVPPRDYEEKDQESNDTTSTVKIPSKPPPLPPRDEMPEHMPTYWSKTPESAKVDAERLSKELSQSLEQIKWWLSGANTSYYNPTVVSSTLALMEQMRHGIPEEFGGGDKHASANHDNSIYKMMQRGFTQNDNDTLQLKRNHQIQRLVSVANQIMIRALYHPKNNNINDNLKSNAYGTAITEMMNEGQLNKDTLEDLMAFIEAIEDQQLQLEAMRGPFDRQAAASSVTTRTSGRAFAKDVKENNDASRVHGSLYIDSSDDVELSYDTTHQQKLLLQQSLYDIDSGLCRHAIFNHFCYYSCMIANDKPLLEVVTKLIATTDEKHYVNVGKALFAMRCQEMFGKEPTTSNESHNVTQKSYSRCTNKILAIAHTLNWLYALGGLLNLTHDIDVSKFKHTSKERPSVPLSVTWRYIVAPALMRACKAHRLNHLSKCDSLQLSTLDDAFETQLNDMVAIGAIGTKYTSGPDKVQPTRPPTYKNMRHAQKELARMLYACQPLPDSSIREGAHWHHIWEQITALQVREMGSPPGWHPKNNYTHQNSFEFVKVSKKDPTVLKVHVSDIIQRLERATELERRCVRAYERRKIEAQYDMSLSDENRLKHLQDFMHAQRCWALRVLRQHPEHFRQYLLLRLELNLGYLRPEVLNPWSIKDINDTDFTSARSKPISREQLQQALENMDQSKVDPNAEDNAWDRNSIVSAIPASISSTISNTVSSLQDIIDEYSPFASERMIVEKQEPVAFCASYIDAKDPSPLSVCAVMLEMRAARSWDELLHIFTAFGIIDYI